MRVCITSSSSLLINGTSVGIAKGQWGICQGDLMSPFLFNIVMEVLSLLVSKDELVGALSVRQVGEKGLSVLRPFYFNEWGS